MTLLKKSRREEGRWVGLTCIWSAFLCFALASLLATASRSTLAQSGKPYAWGANQFGQLGDNSFLDKVTPIQIPYLRGALQLVAGYGRSMILKRDGTVWGWGNNSNGQIGDGTTINRAIPVQVQGLSNVVQISGAGIHSLALKADGTVWAWGYNWEGELGDGTVHIDRLTPVQVIGLTDVVQVVADRWHSLALKKDGTVWAWGVNARGELGDGQGGPIQMEQSSATPVRAVGLVKIVQIAAGYEHSLALQSDGTVWAWGWNIYGELGTSGSYQVAPVRISDFSGVVQISAGGFDSFALKSDGTVWAWGYNGNGELGDGTLESHTVPAQVSGLSGATQIAGGSNHSLALKSDGTVWAWGYNSSGQLGDGTTANSPIPVRVVGIAGQTFAVAGPGYSLSVQAVVQGAKLTVSSFSLAYGKEVILSATLRSTLNGAVLINKPITFSMNGGALGTVNTDASGKAFLTLPNPMSLTLGKHPFSVAFSGDMLYSSSAGSAAFTITKAGTSIKTGALSGRPGDAKNFTAVLKRVTDGAVLSNETLTFKIDGNSIGKALTDATGMATLAFKFGETYAIGAHTLSVEYTGNALHNASSRTAPLNVNQAPTRFSASYDASGKPGRVVKLKAILTRHTDNARLTGKTVHFQIEGADIGSGVTDASGIATLTYVIPSDLSVGKHSITVLFDGDSFYLSCSNNTATLIVR